MSDTQWPRFQVFLQEKEGAPHQDVGSIHAPDIEMALLNARDVFVRRPECVSLWVAPVKDIYSRTAQEIRESGVGEKGIGDGSNQSYYIFNKPKANGTQTFAGAVKAEGSVQALKQALEQFPGKTAPFAWWVVPASSVLKSSPADIASMFEPAFDKPFRMSTDFHTVSAMRQIRPKAPNEKAEKATSVVQNEGDRES
ncbi:MAG: phenylacetic acid degradation protein [Omnitrophica WOR_2 bacterium]